MITISDSKQNIDSNVTLTTVNVDGMIRYWYADDIEDFHKEWWSEDYDGPAAEDFVLNFSIGNKEYADIKKFDEIVTMFGFEKEIDSTAVWSRIVRPCEYVTSELLKEEIDNLWAKIRKGHANAEKLKDKIAVMEEWATELDEEMDRGGI